MATDRAPGWTGAAWIAAVGLAFTIGHFSLGIPLQLFDCYGNMVSLASTSFGDMARSVFGGQPGYYRPLLWMQLKTVFDASGGQYYYWYKGVQLAQVAALLALFVHLLRVRTSRDASAAVFALAVLVGMHTINTPFREVYPINTVTTVVIACLAAASLSAVRRQWWTGLAAVAVFVVAALTVESGLLVWLILAAAYVVGLRGVSGRAVLVTTVLTAVYLLVRFTVLDVGAPGLHERSSGFGFRMLERDEVTARFSDGALAFYAYNVAGNLASLLFSEPRRGVFVFVRSLVTGESAGWRTVNVVASTLSTGLLLWFATRLAGRWRRGQAVDVHDRLAVIALAVAGGNAVLGYAYSKDEIMSPAGVFYALAVYAAARELLGWLALPGRRTAVVLAASAYLAVMGSMWSVRMVGLHASLRAQAFRVREDWATVDQEPEYADAALTPVARSLKRVLQDEAIGGRPWPPALALPLPASWFDQDY